MSVYLLHFDQPIGNPEKSRGQAQHYIGYTSGSVEERVKEHASGAGACIMAAVVDKGIGFRVARVWPEGGRALERKLKAQHNARRLCPLCKAVHS